MFNDIVTVFNLCNGIWYPAVLHNVRLQVESGIDQENSGVSSKDNALLFVQTSSGKVGDKNYLPPKEWLLSAKDSNVTFAEGGFFVSGEYTDIVSDDDYTDGYYSYMRDNFDYCYQITKVQRFSIIPHFEIGGA